MPSTAAPAGDKHHHFAYGTPSYWQAVVAGHIDWQQAQRDQADQAERRRRGLSSHAQRAIVPRHQRPAPAPSRQYAKPIATAAARDRRLSPTAVRCAILIRAQCGNAPGRVITKAALAKAIGCHPKTVQRALSDLRRYGYITTEAVFGPAGLQTGQRIYPATELLPFFAHGRAFPEGADSRPTKVKVETSCCKKGGAAIKPCHQGRRPGGVGAPSAL